MRQKIKLLLCLVLSAAAMIDLSAQSDSIEIHMAVLTAGDSERSVYGRFSYSIGQVAQEYVVGTFPSTKMNQGIQQPYEILVVATQELTHEMIECQVYPNPASTDLTISLGQEAMTPFKTYRLSLFDELGHILYSEVISSPKTRVPVADLAPGMYFLRISDNADHQAVFKITKI